MRKTWIIILALLFISTAGSFSEEVIKDPLVIDVKSAKMTPEKKFTLSWLDEHMSELSEINTKIWEFAEVAMEEYKSSELLASYLEKNGFQVSRGVAGMPTAFVAVYGKGEPVIGILAEYDALPGLSQELQPNKKAIEEGKPGHGCGHNIFGTASTAAAVALKELMQKNKYDGTVKLFGKIKFKKSKKEF